MKHFLQRSKLTRRKFFRASETFCKAQICDFTRNMEDPKGDIHNVFASTEESFCKQTNAVLIFFNFVKYGISDIKNPFKLF